jgi:L-ribulose-5-phosphate 4-epimerase
MLSQDARTLLHVQRFERELGQAKQLLAARLPNRFGTVSARIPSEQRMLVAELYGAAAGAASLVELDLSGHAGYYPASIRELAPLLAAVYQTRPELNTLVHVHSPYLTAYALANRPLPLRYQSTLLYTQCADLPVTPWGARSDPAPVYATLREFPDAPGTLLANHGPLVWSRTSLLDCCHLFLCLEETAELTLLAERLGGARELPAAAREGR